MLIMCVSVVQWSRSCLHTCTPGSTPLRHCFLYLCTISFFLFGLFFLYSYCSPCQSSTPINIRSFILEKGFQKLEKLLICILAKLTTRKKHKLSRHVPPLKQLNFFQYFLANIMTNNTQYTTNCTYLHPTPTSDPLAKVKLAFCTSS